MLKPKKQTLEYLNFLDSLAWVQEKLGMTLADRDRFWYYLSTHYDISNDSYVTVSLPDWTITEIKNETLRRFAECFREEFYGKSEDMTFWVCW